MKFFSTDKALASITREGFTISASGIAGDFHVFTLDESPLRSVFPRKKLLFCADAIRMAGANVLLKFEEAAEILPTDRTGGFLEIHSQLIRIWLVGHGWTSPSPRNGHPHIHIERVPI